MYATDEHLEKMSHTFRANAIPSYFGIPGHHWIEQRHRTGNFSHNLSKYHNYNYSIDLLSTSVFLVYTIANYCTPDRYTRKTEA
jgi:hypothetical protein